MDTNKTIIMVVDDQTDFVEGVKLILEVEGYEVWSATNGRKALDQLESAAQNLQGGEGPIPDLILADIMMPVMDGYTLYENTQENPALKNIPFIFLTAKTATSDLQHGKELGVEDYLTKPCVPDVLLASVRGQLKGGDLIQSENGAMPYNPAKQEIVAGKAESRRFGTANIIFVFLAIAVIVTLLISAINIVNLGG